MQPDRGYKTFVFDLDGTIHVDFEPIKTVLQFARTLDPSRCYYVSNSDRYSGSAISSYLKDQGLEVVDSQCATTLDLIPRALALIHTGKKHVSSPTSNPAVHDAIRSAGYSITHPRDTVPVILGYADDALETIKLLRSNPPAELWVTNGDQKISRSTGYIPGLGALLQDEELLQGAKIIGKPSLLFADVLGIPAGKQTIVIGDNPNVDGVFAANLGASFHLVSNGIWH